MTYSYIFFDFMRFCIGVASDIPKSIEGTDWYRLYDIAKKQALIGVMFDGIQKLPKELAPPPQLLMQWMGMAQKIKQQNIKVNMVATNLYAQLRNDGLRCCILKGQGNALMYPNPLARTPGDIDVWVNVSREQTTEYAKLHFKLGNDIRYYHLETSINGVPVELHFYPCIMNNPIYNHRLQKWFKQNVDLQCSNIVHLPDEAGKIAMPTTAFNIIYQLCHLYHHFFDEGIGMRQMIDYYFVVEKLHTDLTDIAALQRDLKWLGLWKFAGAVMYVLHEVFGLSEDKMIVPMDVKRGRLLLSEILDGGNFGKHYSKYGHFTQQGMAKKYFLKIWRNMHFVGYYPAEALCEPVFRTWHFLWRMHNKG